MDVEPTFKLKKNINELDPFEVRVYYLSGPQGRQDVILASPCTTAFNSKKDLISVTTNSSES